MMRHGVPTNTYAHTLVFYYKNLCNEIPITYFYIAIIANKDGSKWALHYKRLNTENPERKRGFKYFARENGELKKSGFRWETY